MSNLTDAITFLDKPTLAEWFIGLRDISEFIFSVPLYGFIVLLIIGYSLFTRNVLDGVLIGGFFGIFLAIMLVAMGVLNWLNVAVILGMLIVGIMLKMLLNN
jgi:hypothetical protein